MKAVFVLFDSLNRSALGCYGGTEVSTPNFDRFAARSATFDNHYVGSLPCMPARRDMHTGRLNFMHRSWGSLEPFDNSMPEILKKRGTHTHLVTDHFHYFEDGGGTYHPRYSTWELVRGQEYDPWKGEVGGPSAEVTALYSDLHYNSPEFPNRSQHQVNRQHIRSERDFPGPQCFERAFEFLDVNATKDDWMLQIECFDPHEPFFAPERFREQYPTAYDGPILDWPKYGPVSEADGEIDEVRANYAALVSMCDAYFGKLLDYFDEHDMWKDTCLIVTTDHGFLLSEHDWWGKNIPPYFEEISHIPLMVHNPNRPELAGTRPRCLTQTIDLMPTILGLFGAPIPEEVTGRSIFDLVEEPNERTLIFGMFGGPVGVTDGRYAYYHYPSDLDAEGLNEYTLMPTHLKGMFTASELSAAKLHPPFDFTKNVPVLSVPALTTAGKPPGPRRDLFKRFGTVLYDVVSDPLQQAPLEDEAIAGRLLAAMVSELERHDAPKELFGWLGVETGGRA